MENIPENYRHAETALNAPTRVERLSALRTLAAGVERGEIPAAPDSVEVNNHVHTSYSFSPHSPCSAAWHARRAGLRAVGIMDHDSVAGAAEMLEAGAVVGIATTTGFEVRVNFAGTPFAERLINGPGLTGIAYIAVHGIPAPQLARCADFLRPIQHARNARNAAMVERLNDMLLAQGLPPLDFEREVAGISQAVEGGSITERHLLAALSRQFIAHHGRGTALVAFLEEQLRLPLSGNIRHYLSDAQNPHYLYDLLGVLKAQYTDAFFIHPEHNECIHVHEVLAFAESIGAISAYAYLGDVTDSPTGDKRAEKFEDDFLEELMSLLHTLGFRAITYMPPRNTAAQLERIARLCEEHGFMQISGVDINSSRQTFNCPEILDPRFANLITATWALIGHEKLSSVNPGCGLFGAFPRERYPRLADRLEHFAAIGQAIDPHTPQQMPPVAEKFMKSLTETRC